MQSQAGKACFAGPAKGWLTLGCNLATPRSHLGCPSATTWSPERLAEGAKAFRPALQIAESAFPGRIQAYLFTRSFTRECRRSQANHFNENFLTLSCRIRYCTAQRRFGSTCLKLSRQIKTVEQEKTKCGFREVFPARTWGRLSGVSAFLPL